jgi:hypothetical protein
MPTLYRKTAQGAAEIETRQHQLPPRLRQLLILVDGKRSTRELARLLPDHCAQILATLARQGFIERVLQPVPPPRVAEPVPGWPPALHALLTPTPPPAPTPEFVVRRHLVVQALHDTLGEPAQALAVFLENAHNDQELKPLLAEAAARVAALRGLGAAEAFVERWVAVRPLSASRRPAAAGARSSGRQSFPRPGAR